MFAKWLERLMRRLAPRDAPPTISTVEEARMTLEERVSQWPRQWLEQGRAQGIEQGRAQGIEQGRALLCRLAARKFDAAAGEGLASALAGVADPERLAQVGDWIIECETGADLLARAPAQTRERGPSSAALEPADRAQVAPPPTTTGKESRVGRGARQDRLGALLPRLRPPGRCDL